MKALVLSCILLISLGAAADAAEGNSTAWVEHDHPKVNGTNGREEPGASAFLVSAANFSLEYIPAANATYARVPNTVLAGDELVDGQANIQPTFEDCAVSCSKTATCIGIDWCDTVECPVDQDGAQVPLHSCRLAHMQPAEEAKGVIQVGSGNPRLGEAGVRVLISPPAQVPEGYVLFMAQSLQEFYEMPCEGSPTPGQCTLLGSQQELVDRCNAWRECQAVVVGPRGWGRYRMPFGELKGQTDPSLPLDPKNGNLNPVTYTLVKASALAPSESASSSGGLSAGAVAGIVIGATAVAAIAAVAAVLLVKRRRRRGIIELKLSGGPSHVSSLGEELVASWGREKSGGDSAKKLVARLLSEAPNPQWADVIVPRDHVKFSTKNGKAVRLGAGASGTVFRGMLHGATPCALKVYDFHEDAALPKYFIQEAVMLRRLSHPGIVQFLGVTMTEGRGLLIMELVAGGDLGAALRSDSEAHLDDPKQRLYSWYNRGRLVALQIAAGLQYLHAQRILHLDLKSHNVLLARDGTAKIADVGFSKMIQSTHVSGLEGRVGTWNWCAPEVLLGGRATEKSDIYSLGIVLWELITGQQPQRGLITSPEVPAQCPPEIADLHLRCVSQEPSERPTAEEVVKVIRAWLSAARSRACLAEGGPAVEEGAPVEAEVATRESGLGLNPEQPISGTSTAALVSCPSDAAPPGEGSEPSSSSAAGEEDKKAAGADDQPPSPTAVATSVPNSFSTSAGSLLSGNSAAAAGAGRPAGKPQQQTGAGMGADVYKYQHVELRKETIVSPFAAGFLPAPPRPAS